MMTLDDLVGPHSLDGVDTHIDHTVEITDKSIDAERIRFRLDGVVYTVIEDPDDGYRSAMRELRVESEAKINNAFPAVQVVGRKKAPGAHDDCASDVLQLVDVTTQKVVMEVGTDYADAYYPMFVSSFFPENMVTNSEPGE